MDGWMDGWIDRQIDWWVDGGERVKHNQMRDGETGLRRLKHQPDTLPRSVR